MTDCKAQTATVEPRVMREEEHIASHKGHA
jgi:hypothetical protein